MTRIRVPGGVLTAAQGRVVTEISDRLQGSLEITNRANFQIRGLQQTMPLELLRQLQLAGLAAPTPEVDHLRNIMASPTAGIDPKQLVDTRPLVGALNAGLSRQLHLASLSAKFSIGIDGGEQTTIARQPNDLVVSAFAPSTDPSNSEMRFAVQFRGVSLPKTPFLQYEQCQPFIMAIAQVYLEKSLENPQHFSRAKPRLREVLNFMGVERFLGELQQRLSFSWQLCTPNQLPQQDSSFHHLGVHPQRQSGLYYVGIALPLGRLNPGQLQQLCTLSESYGSGTLRLTPWRNLILSDIAEQNLPAVQKAIAQLGLDSNSNSIWGGLIACSGSTGCASSATDTQADARAIAQAITQNLDFDLELDLKQPITLHLSGCSKSCAHHQDSDITLVGIQAEGKTAYRLFVGDRQPLSAERSDQPLSFGKLLTSDLTPEEVPNQILKLLKIYRQRRNSAQSFRAFVNDGAITQLRDWMILSERSTHA